MTIPAGPVHLAAEAATEVALLRAAQAELAIHAAQRELACRFTDVLIGWSVRSAGRYRERASPGQDARGVGSGVPPAGGH